MFTYDLSRITDYTELCWLDREPSPDDARLVRLNPVTESLIFKTMSVGIGEITEANAAEFYARVHLVEQIDGPSMFGMPEGRPDTITVEDVRQHIGLQTNATYKVETRSKWLSRVIGQELDTAARRYEAAAKAVLVAAGEEQ